MTNEKRWRPKNEKVVVGDDSKDRWIIVRKEFPKGPEYFLQIRKTDATKPYYLTQRIFVSRIRAEKELQYVKKFGRFLDQSS